MNKDKLIQAGIDYDEGAERFGGNAAIYEKYLIKFFSYEYQEKIASQLAQGDIAGAFRTVHDLKGAAGNLSLNRCYRALCALTELLRAQDPNVVYENELAQVNLWYDRAKSAVTEEKP